MSTLAKQLGFLDRNELALVLDQHSPRGLDWRGLADRMGFSYTVIVTLEKKESPTIQLLLEWERRFGAEASLDKLIALVDSLGIQEAVDMLQTAKTRKTPRVETMQHPHVESICQEETHRDRTDSSQSVKSSQLPLTPCNSIDPTQLDPEFLRRMQQQTQQVDPQQVLQRIQEMDIRERPDPPPTDSYSDLREELRRHQYDVFLSFNQVDEEFAEEVRQRLQSTNLRVYIPSENVLPGRVYSEEIADVITDGCRKVVVILSPDYIQSEWCSFAIKMAVHVSPDFRKHLLIPIIYRPCKVPSFIQLLWCADYTRCYDRRPQEVEKIFWQRVFDACANVPAARR